MIGGKKILAYVITSLLLFFIVYLICLVLIWLDILSNTQQAIYISIAAVLGGLIGELIRKRKNHTESET